MDSFKFAMTSAKDFHDGYYTTYPRLAVGAAQRILNTWAYCPEVSPASLPRQKLSKVISSSTTSACTFEVVPTQICRTTTARRARAPGWHGTQTT